MQEIFPKQIDLKLLSWPTTSPFEPQNKQIPTHFQTTFCLLSSKASILGGGVAGLGLCCKSAAVWVANRRQRGSQWWRFGLSDGSGMWFGISVWLKWWVLGFQFLLWNFFSLAQEMMVKLQICLEMVIKIWLWCCKAKRRGKRDVKITQIIKTQGWKYDKDYNITWIIARGGQLKG